MLDVATSFVALLPGLLVTLQVSLACGILSVVLSLATAVASISPWFWLRALAVGYAELFRAIPMLALLIFIYYGVGSYTSKLGLSATWLAIIGITLSESAYLSQVYRATLEAIPVSQWDAARSLGLRWFQCVRLVILPQVSLPAIPSTLNMLISVIKNSSLASLIAVSEVTLVATNVVAENFLPMQVYVALGILYLAVIIPLAFLTARLERAIRGASGRGAGPRSALVRATRLVVGRVR